MCKTLKVTSCGKDSLYAVVSSVVLLPFILQKDFKSIGKFSMFVLVVTLSSIAMIVYVCIVVYKTPLNEVEPNFGIEITQEDRHYITWNWAMFPVFCSAMMNLFEGNQQILNLYAENDKPKQFFSIVVALFVGLLLFVSIFVGILGYLTFGNEV